MKILFVPTSYPDKDNPTRDIFIYEQACALAKSGNDIRVLHLKKQPSKSFLKKIDYTVKVENDGFALRYTLPTKTFMENKFAGFHKKSFIKGVKKLYCECTKDGWIPDVVYAHFSCWAGVAAIELGKEHGIPVAVIEHYSGFMGTNVSAAKINGLKYVTENADAVLCVSERLKESILKLTGTNEEIQVVPNMIDEGFNYCKHTVNDKFIFCTVCNLNERKRVKLLVKAFCKAFSKNDKVQLIIGGDGPEKKNIVDVIHEFDRQDQITMLGRLDRKGTIDLYSKSNCFALVSAHETFGIVWREAMATGLPVITSNHEGWSDNDWSNEYGIMVNVDDEQGLIIAFKSIINFYDKFDCLAISNYSLNNYSQHKIVEKLQTIFSKTLVDYSRNKKELKHE